MNGLQLLPVFLVGLAGSVHCVGMCGGIVGALSATAPARPVIRIAPTPAADSALRVLAYNGGRLSSYMLAGALAGGLANGAQALVRLAGWQLGFYWMANLMLVALGLYLMDAWRGLAQLEAGGQLLWRRAQSAIAPMMRSVMPVDRPLKAYALGALWGWVPCGMVYSVLLTAMLSGSAIHGAAVMLAFGLGTLPMLGALGLAGARVRAALQRPRVRIASGVLVLSFGLLGLARAAHGLSLGWLDSLCLTAHP
jgi:sulfite exporter TauE/SafE